MMNAPIDQLDIYSYAFLGIIQAIFTIVIIASFVVIRESKYSE